MSARTPSIGAAVNGAPDFRWQQDWLSEVAELTRSVLGGESGDPLRLLVERVQDMTDAEVVAVVGRDAERRCQVIESVGPVERYADDDGGVDVESAVLVELAGPSLASGALALFPRTSGRPFTPAETEAAATLAEQVSVALDLAQSRSDRERLALLDERDRIARDLHDHVIQRLFAIGLTVQSIAAQLAGDAAERLLSGVDALDETIEQIRSTIYRLRGPVVPAPKSISTKMGELVQAMEPVLGFPAQFEIHGPVEFGVDDEVGDDCVAVLREALTNVARHAEGHPGVRLRFGRVVLADARGDRRRRRGRRVRAPQRVGQSPGAGRGAPGDDDAGAGTTAAALG